MGVLPLRFMEGQNAETLGLDGSEVYDIEGLSDALQPKSEVTVKAKSARMVPWWRLRQSRS